MTCSTHSFFNPFNPQEPTDSPSIAADSVRKATSLASTLAPQLTTGLETKELLRNWVELTRKEVESLDQQGNMSSYLSSTTQLTTCIFA